MDRVELDEMKAMFIKERKTKGITIAMPEKLHNEIKIKATERCLSMKSYIMQAVFERLAKDQQYE